MNQKFTVDDIDNIDRTALDEEWLKQPAMYRYFATQAEDANTEADRLEAAVKVVDAEIEKEIREWAEKNESKVTDKSVAADVLNNPKHQQVVEKALNARHEARVLNNAVVRSLDHRKKALEKLVELELNGYNSTPKEPREMKDTFKERASDKKMTEALDKNKKRRK